MHIRNAHVDVCARRAENTLFLQSSPRRSAAVINERVHPSQVKRPRIHGRVTTIPDDGSRIKEGSTSLLGRSRIDTEKHGKLHTRAACTRGNDE